MGQLLQTIRDGEVRENTFFVLTTVGGDARAAYRIARLFQMVSKKFYLCVPSMCKSAGTLIALGAHEIVMNPFAELGPLDVQLVQRDEIDRSRSGLVVDTALEGLAKKTLETFETIMLHITFGSDKSISFEAASKVAASLTTGTMSEIYAQIKPDDLGNDLRNLRVAEAYGNRLGAALLRRGVFALFMGLFARGCVSPVLISGGQQPSQRVPASFPAASRASKRCRTPSVCPPLRRAPFWTFARRSGTVPWEGRQACDGCDDRIPGTYIRRAANRRPLHRSPEPARVQRPMLSSRMPKPSSRPAKPGR